MIRREIHPITRVLDEKQGLVQYTASTEKQDSYNEIIRADGWRFDDFEKNSPFVDSHDYSSINKVIGHVTDFRVERKNLVNVVKWAIDVSENVLAQLGFKMTVAGHLKAVSVGFMPVRTVTPYDRDQQAWRDECQKLDMDPDKTDCRGIYLEQQQKELSACVIGANPDALARSYSDGILTDSTITKISKHFPEFSRRVERAVKPARRSYSFSTSQKQPDAIGEMMTALGLETEPTAAATPTAATMKTKPSTFSEQLANTGTIFFDSIESARRSGSDSEIELAVRKAFASVAREQHAAYGDPVVRYLDAKPERRFFWNAVARRLGGGFRADSPEAKVWQRAVSGINLQDTFGPGLLESMPVADEIWNLILQFGQYKYLGLRKMIGAYTRYAQVTQYPNAIFITPSGQGQTTIPEDTSLLGSALTPLANTIACLITCSLAWLQDEKVDLSEVLLSKFVQGLAARIDYGCFQGNGQDDQTNGMCTGLFADLTIPAYVAPAGETTIAGLQRNDFINTIAQVAPAALQRMDSQPPRWFISPVLIPQLLVLWDGTAKNYLLKTPAETRGEWLLVGFPVTFCAQAPSVNAANAKVAVFGNGDAMLVALQEKFEIAKSDKGAAFGSANASFRALGRGRSSLRVANGFASLKLAAG